LTAILSLGFEDNQYPVIIHLITGESFELQAVQWDIPRKDWAAPTGVMVRVDNPNTNAPANESLTVFVPWNNVKFLTQIYPAPVGPEPEDPTQGRRKDK